MPPAFTEADLLVDISQAELDGLAKTLVTGGDPQPIATTITEQIGKVEDYTLRYELTEARYKRLVRALVLHELYARLGTIVPKRERKYDEAMKELIDIRDGKFPDLAIEDPPPDGLPDQEAKWGSKTKIL